MKKIAVIFGGQSTEHDVSVVSGLYISKCIDKQKYDVTNIYIDQKGIWYIYDSSNYNIELGEQLNNLKPIKFLIEFLKTFDCIFPALHGLYGEDGTIQGLFELLKIPYVGCKVLGSSLAMDKVYAKIIFNQAGLKQVNYEYIRKHNDKFIYIDKNFNEAEYSLTEISKLIEKNIKYPMFVKPSNSGSSIGITKASNIKELQTSIEEAAKYDKKILIEEGIEMRELECAVLGNEDVLVSCVGEIMSADDFYDYDSKYKNASSYTVNHADLDPKIEDKIKKQAIKAFKSVDGKGLSRVDFFLDKENNIYINEINTMPGFTGISMYPKLMEESGIDGKSLTTKLIELAFEE